MGRGSGNVVRDSGDLGRDSNSVGRDSVDVGSDSDNRTPLQARNKSVSSS